MQLITDLFRIESCQPILTETFEHNKRKWEEVDLESEKAFIGDGYFHMVNSSSHSWNYYKIKTNLKQGQHFAIETSIELEKTADAYGHFGLVWGFDKDRNYLNRFTLSADGKRALVMHFEKDHHRIIHRFQNRKFPKVNTKKPIRFSIFKLEAYYHFFINKRKVYMAHESFFCAKGPYAGYYIEPELSMKSNFFQVKKIGVRNLEVITGLQMLMSE